MKAGGFQRWLKDTMGLDAGTIGPSLVERAVQGRIDASGRAGLADYWQLLRHSAPEQQELIEAVVVPETWFFRDAQAFAALARHVGPAWAAARPGQRARLLSLPCSSGEEPYTMVMSLAEAGFPIERLDVDAIDISERALHKARHGVYGGNSFRGGELGFRARHFQAVAGGWRLPESIRARVNFSQGNVLDPNFLAGFVPGEGCYEAIFCRNLLIYFDEPTQRRTVEILTRLLKPQGLLFVGPSEASLLLSLGLRPVPFPMAFGFRQQAPAPEQRSPSAQSASWPVAAPPLAASQLGPASIGSSSLASSSLAPSAIGPSIIAAPRTARASAAPRRAAVATRPGAAAGPASALAASKPLAGLRTAAARSAAEPAPAPPEASLLDTAQALADGGRFAEAAAACETHLQAQGPSARGLDLSGLIEGALGREALAEDRFRKTLYLQPCHEEALMHLALLLETRGDAAGGRVLRLRAQRCRAAAKR